jgi:hypothetical protein
MVSMIADLGADLLQHADPGVGSIEDPDVLVSHHGACGRHLAAGVHYSVGGFGFGQGLVQAVRAGGLAVEEEYWWHNYPENTAGNAERTYRGCATGGL